MLTVTQQMRAVLKTSQRASAADGRDALLRSIVLWTGHGHTASQTAIIGCTRARRTSLQRAGRATLIAHTRRDRTAISLRLTHSTPRPPPDD